MLLDVIFSTIPAAEYVLLVILFSFFSFENCVNFVSESLLLSIYIFFNKLFLTKNRGRGGIVWGRCSCVLFKISMMRFK